MDAQAIIAVLCTDELFGIHQFQAHDPDAEVVRVARAVRRIAAYREFLQTALGAMNPPDWHIADTTLRHLEAKLAAAYADLAVFVNTLHAPRPAWP